ncbi:MAG: hypothetical protein KDH96_10640 [Candidatus Riesia sp.]|nr:hypothetical protein [Candidatus Riesia sp.]
MKTLKNKLLAGFMLLGMTSCVTDPNFVAYVRADRAEFEVTKRQLIDYIDLDTRTDLALRESYKRRLQAKDDSITAAEKYLGIVQ